MLKFLVGDQIQIPELVQWNSGVSRDAIGVAGRSKVSFGKGAEGQIDLPIPNSRTIASLPATRFEKISAIAFAVPGEI